MSEPPTGYDLALNQFALITCIKHLQGSKDALKLQRPQDALLELQFAWSLLPNSVRDKFPDPPTKAFRSKASQVPALEKKAAQKTPEALVEELRDEKARDRELASLASSLVLELSVEYITELDRQGLYVQKERTGVEQTSRKKATEQPPTKGLPTTLPRGSP
jgi:hypothetical protein